MPDPKSAGPHCGSKHTNFDKPCITTQAANIIKPPAPATGKKSGLPMSHSKTRAKAFLLTMSIPAYDHTEATRAVINAIIAAKSGRHFSPKICRLANAGTIHFEISEDGYEHGHACIPFAEASTTKCLWNALRAYSIAKGYPQTSVHFNHCPAKGQVGYQQVAAAGGPADYIQKYLTSPCKNKLVDTGALRAPPPTPHLYDRVLSGPMKGARLYKTPRDLENRIRLNQSLVRLRFLVLGLPDPCAKKRRRS